jgi:hypothetical protein
MFNYNAVEEDPAVLTSKQNVSGSLAISMGVAVPGMYS